MNYFQRLRKHPGFWVAIIATVLTIFIFSIPFFSSDLMEYKPYVFVPIGFYWILIFVTNNYITKNTENCAYKFKPRKTSKKLSLLHYIKTDKSEYHIYNIECLEGTNVSVWIERNGESILQPEVFDESFGTMCGQSFTSFVISCLNMLRSDIKHRGEFIIKDEKIKND